MPVGGWVGYKSASCAFRYLQTSLMHHINPNMTFETLRIFLPPIKAIEKDGVTDLQHIERLGGDDR